MIRYVLVTQQKTMLGEPGGAASPRVRHLQGVFTEAGFSTAISADIDGWLLGHSAFVVSIAFALYRVGIDAAKLAADPTTMRLMVRATRQAFAALVAAGEHRDPEESAHLYRLPTPFVVAYWRRVPQQPQG